MESNDKQDMLGERRDQSVSPTNPVSCLLSKNDKVICKSLMTSNHIAQREQSKNSLLAGHLYMDAL